LTNKAKKALPRINLPDLAAFFVIVKALSKPFYLRFAQGVHLSIFYDIARMHITM